MQTGVQILTGFLVVLPFQSRFEDLTSFQTGIYLVTLCLAVLAMGFLMERWLPSSASPRSSS